MRQTVFSALLSLAVCACPSVAHADPPTADEADEDPNGTRVNIAVGATIATILAPVVIGALHTANADPNENKQRNIGLAIAGMGPALSPLVGHAVLGEWKRSALFSAVPVASEIGIVALLSAKPDAVFQGTEISRNSFSLLFSLNIFGAAVSLVDVMLARDRMTGKSKLSLGPLHDVAVSPMAGRQHAGLAFGGTL